MKIETREERDIRIGWTIQAKQYIEGEKHSSTKLINGKTIAWLSEIIILLSGLADRYMDALENKNDTT